MTPGARIDPGRDGGQETLDFDRRSIPPASLWVGFRLAGTAVELYVSGRNSNIFF